MIGLDANVLVRYLAQDDPKQSAVATRFIEDRLSVEDPGFFATVTLCEIAWVLAESYGADGFDSYRATGTGMMAKPTAIPRARITAAMMIATEIFPFLISSHSLMGVSQSKTRNRIPRPQAIDTAPTTPHPIAIR